MANGPLPGEGYAGGSYTDVISPPNGTLFSETNDNSVSILLTFGTARVLLAGDAEKGEEYMSSGSHTGPLTVPSALKTINNPSYYSARC